MTQEEQAKAGAAQAAGSDRSPVADSEQAANAGAGASPEASSAAESGAAAKHSPEPSAGDDDGGTRRRAIKPSPSVLGGKPEGSEAVSFDPGDDSSAAREPENPTPQRSAPAASDAPRSSEGPGAVRRGGPGGFAGAPRGGGRGPGGPGGGRGPGGPGGRGRGPGGPGGRGRGPGGPGGRGPGGPGGDRDQGRLRRSLGGPAIVRPPVPIPIQPFLEIDIEDEEKDMEKEFGEEMEAFDEQLEEYLPDSMNELNSGDMVDALVVAVREDDVLLDVGDKAECLVPAQEFAEDGEVKVAPGDSVKVLITGRGPGGQLNVSFRKALRFLGLARVQEAYKSRALLQGTITKEVKGGLIVDIDGVQAFLPASQVDMQRVDELEGWVGKKINCYVIDYIRDRRRVIVSHREVLEEEHNMVRDAVISQLNIDEIVGATVKSITDFGVFVDLGGGVDGLIPREEVSWEKGGHPGTYVTIGEPVTVKVLSITRTERKTKISLSRKQAKADPFEILPVKYPPGSEVDGEIVGITHFGAFVRIEEGIQGMVHVSDLSWSGGNKRVKDYVNIGDKVHCQVIDIDSERRRLSLGMKQLQDDPWELIEHRFPAGSRVKGTITSLVQYGAFVRIADDLEGLIHISDFSWDKKVTKPSQVLKKGDEIECLVLAIDKEDRRLSLGMKQLTPSPFETFTATVNVGDTVEGKITKLESFGAFVEVTPNVEGLLHVSQISEQRVEDPSQVLKAGEKIQVKITKIDRKNEKISLSRREVLRDLEKQEIETYMVSASEQERKVVARSTMGGESLLSAFAKAKADIADGSSGVDTKAKSAKASKSRKVSEDVPTMGESLAAAFAKANVDLPGAVAKDDDSEDKAESNGESSPEAEASEEPAKEEDAAEEKSAS